MKKPTYGQLKENFQDSRRLVLTCIIPKGHIVLPSGSEVIAQVVTSGAYTENACVALILMSDDPMHLHWSSFSFSTDKNSIKVAISGPKLHIFWA